MRACRRYTLNACLPQIYPQCASAADIPPERAAGRDGLLFARMGVSNTRMGVSNTRLDVSNTRMGVSDTRMGLPQIYPRSGQQGALGGELAKLETVMISTHSLTHTHAKSHTLPHTRTH